MVEHIYLSGKTKWFKNLTPNEWGKWNHVLYPDEQSLEKIRELQGEGVKNPLKKDEDGYSINLSRRTIFEMRGKPPVGQQPPQVMLADGTPLPRDTLVGNGSDVTTKMAVYSHRTPSGGRAKAMRWEATRIDNLVPFEKTTDFTPEESKQRKGLQEQPTPVF